MNQGTVIKSAGRDYSVRSDNGKVFLCHTKGKLRMEGFRATNPVAVGDHVEFETQAGDLGSIVNILPRKNYIIRKAIKQASEIQVIAANVDQAILIASLVAPKTLSGFIDRYLVTAQAYSIPVIIVFNKIDLYREEEKNRLAEMMHAYTRAGYDCFYTSVIKNININKIEESLKGKITLLSGNSGVGKSTIINRIQPGLNLKTREVSVMHQSGIHVTTFAEMFALSMGGSVIDTPGVKSFGVVDFNKKDLFHYFPEIFKMSCNCKFNDCSHINEPKCAVKEAVENGEIAESRYASYLKIFNGEDMEVEYDD